MSQEPQKTPNDVIAMPIGLLDLCAQELCIIDLLRATCL